MNRLGKDLEGTMLVNPDAKRDCQEHQWRIYIPNITDMRYLRIRIRIMQIQIQLSDKLQTIIDERLKDDNIKQMR